jgi:uracil-DNA glycosylase
MDDQLPPLKAAGIQNEKTHVFAKNIENQRENDFRCLIARVQSCRCCPRMEGRTRVFGPKNGSIDAKILFVAEAPGRLGADRSGIPLTGDQTGRNFEFLLRAAQLTRDDIFITNAVLCNPRDEQGYNAPPTLQELENCSNHLRETINILQPHYVIALGKVALQALCSVAQHELILSKNVGSPQKWNARWLIALYHPSPRAQTYRSREKQVEDFQRLGSFIRSNSPL